MTLINFTYCPVLGLLKTSILNEPITATTLHRGQRFRASEVKAAPKVGRAYYLDYDDYSQTQRLQSAKA